MQRKRVTLSGLHNAQVWQIVVSSPEANLRQSTEINGEPTLIFLVSHDWLFPASVQEGYFHKLCPGLSGRWRLCINKRIAPIFHSPFSTIRSLNNAKCCSDDLWDKSVQISSENRWMEPIEVTSTFASSYVGVTDCDLPNPTPVETLLSTVLQSPNPCGMIMNDRVSRICNRRKR